MKRLLVASTLKLQMMKLISSNHCLRKVNSIAESQQNVGKNYVEVIDLVREAVTNSGKNYELEAATHCNHFEPKDLNYIIY